jgi:hypothetical protein
MGEAGAWADWWTPWSTGGGDGVENGWYMSYLGPDGRQPFEFLRFLLSINRDTRLYSDPARGIDYNEPETPSCM